MADLDWLDEGAEGEETVFELEPTSEERAAIVSSLVAERIRHRWETVDELVVADVRADAVDIILDDVLGAETRVEIGGGPAQADGSDGAADDEELFDDDDDGEDEEHDDGSDYQVLSQLYLATGRLQKRRDPDEVSDFLIAAGAALVTPQPFGVDEETWADIQSAARNLATQLESEVPEEGESIEGDLKALRNQLHQLV